MKIEITKLTELPDALHPNNIPEGYKEVFKMDYSPFKEPEVGERFWPCSWWSTSGVQEVINENTFRTYSSIYMWRMVEDEL